MSQLSSFVQQQRRIIGSKDPQLASTVRDRGEAIMTMYLFLGWLAVTVTLVAVEGGIVLRDILSDNDPMQDNL